MKIPALLLALLACACQSTHTSPSPSAGPDGAQAAAHDAPGGASQAQAGAADAARKPDATHAHAADGAHPAAAPSTPGAAPRANRDEHGPADVDAYVQSLLSPERVARFRIPLVLEKLDPEPDAVIGDLGCGPGLFSEAFARRCPRGLVYAADVEPRQLDALNARLASSGLRNVVPVLATYADPHFPPAGLDLVFIADTYHHLDDRIAYMRRLAESLKPGGRVVLLDYKPGPMDHGPPPEHKLPAGTMEREMREAGYVLVQSFDTHPDHDFQIWRPMTPWEKERR